MPKIEIPQTEFFARYVRNYNDDGLAYAIRSTGVKYLGEGNESLVVAMPGNPDEAVATRFAEMSPEDARLQFHLQRVMSTLFPHNFPRFHMATAGKGILGKTDQKLAGTIRQRIIVSPATEIKYPFKTARVKSEEMGIPIYHIDSARRNFAVGIDGGEYYLDNLLCMKGSLQKLGSDNPNWQLSRILNHMDKMGFSQDDISTVTSSMIRAYALAGSFTSSEISGNYIQ